MIFKQISLITFLNESKPFLLHTVKWFQVLLCITNISIKLQSLVCIQLSDKTVLFQTLQFCIRR